MARTVIDNVGIEYELLGPGGDTSITLRVEEDMRASYGLAAGTRDASDPRAALLHLAHHLQAP